MTRHEKLTVGSSPLSAGNLAGAASPRAAPATFSRCPDCGAVFSDRIVDEDTGCSYPVDDGEYYCEVCDSLFTDEYLAGTEWKAPTWLAEGWARVEL